MEAAGGLGAIGPGDTVYIKPNAVHPAAGGSPGTATAPDILRAVIDLIAARRPERIVVGDRPARSFDSLPTLEALTFHTVVDESPAHALHAPKRPLERADDWVLVPVAQYQETWDDLGGVQAMRAIVEADHFINLAQCKDHRWAAFSLSLKNLIGAVGDDTRDRMHYVSGDPERLSRDICLLNQAFAPTLNIVDARTALLNGGPEGTGADVVRSTPGLVLASTDRVALDALAAAIIQRDGSVAEIPAPDAAQPSLAGPLWSLPQLRHGRTLALGAPDPALTELAFDSMCDGEADALEARFRV